MDELVALAGGLRGQLAIAIVGRLALSFLPPGLVGSHRPRDWPLTWAVSYVLGALVVGVLWSRVLPAATPPTWLLAAGTVAMLVRFFTLPAAMVPRHAPPAETASTLAHGLAFAITTVLALAWIGAARQPGEPALARTAAWVALVILLGHGLEQARRAPTGRRWVLLLAACLAYSLQSSARADDWLLTLFFGSGCVFLIPWLRRADRRARTLSSLCFAGCLPWLTYAWPLLLAGLGGLILFSARASRARAARAAAIALTCVGLPWLVAGAPGAGSAAARIEPALMSTAGAPALGWPALGWIWALSALALGLIACLRMGPGARNARGVEAPRRELAALLSILCFCLIAQWLRPALGASAAEIRWGLLHTAPCAVLIVGLALLRSEQPA